MIKGMDISMLDELEKMGVSYYDQGEKNDLITILEQNGVNTIRLRVWKDPYDDKGNVYGGGTVDEKVLIDLAKRIKQKNMKFILDIHYSDFWADPAKQFKPKAWKDISGQELVDVVYRYTKNLLVNLKEEGIVPEMVQVGNEITNGLLWPDGRTPNYDGMFNLIKSGVRAVREVMENSKIILHLDYGGDNKLYRSWFDEAVNHNVDYDVIGLSYYPFWHGTLKELEYNLDDISERYNKDVLILETSYGFTLETREGLDSVFSQELAEVAGYSADVVGQSKYISDLFHIMKNVKNNRGLGIVYWEPAWIPVEDSSWTTIVGQEYIKDYAKRGNTWANQALFDYDGNSLETLKLFKKF